VTRNRPPGTRPVRAGIRRVVVLLTLTLVALTGLTGATGGSTARAGTATRAVTAPLASVAVTTLDPVIGRPGGALTVSGTVRGGRERLRDVHVALRLSQTPVNSRAELAGVASGLTTGKDGDVVRDEAIADLPIDATAPFTLTRPLRQLSALQDFGVYVLSVEVTARHRTGEGQVAILRTFLPWVPRKQAFQPTGFALLWPLAGEPSRQANGRYEDDRLAGEMAPTGRLGRLTAAGGLLGQRLPLSWAIDGDLVDSAADMSGGYRAAGTSAAATEAGALLAQGWLQQVRTATTGHDVLPLPYADPDLPALRRSGLLDDIAVSSTTSAAAIAGVLDRDEISTDLSWPSDGVVDRRTLTQVRTSGAEAVVLAGATQPTRLQLDYTPTGRSTARTRAGTMTSLVADSGLTTLLADGGTQPLLAAQRFVAETAMITAELPSAGGSRVVLAAPPTRWDPPQAFLDRLVTGLSDATWLTGTSLDEMRASSPGEVERRPVRYPPGARRAELPRAYLSAVRSQHARIDLYGKVIDGRDPRRTAVLSNLDKSVLRLESTWWHGRDNVRVNRISDDQRTLSNVLGSIRVQPGSYTLGSKSGSLPLTISNGTNRAIVVTLRLEPRNRRLRLTVPDQPLRIAAHRKRQVDVGASAVAAGPVVVDATLHATDGSPLATAPVQLAIRVTQLGTVALIITLSAAGVLFLAAGVRIVRRARAARRTPTPARELP
jgi:hypothetical protein